MVINENEIPLMPGNHGKNCLGNGEHYKYENGQPMCLCDECDYMMCCFGVGEDCDICKDVNCPRRIMDSEGSV